MWQKFAELSNTVVEIKAVYDGNEAAHVPDVKAALYWLKSDLQRIRTFAQALVAEDADKRNLAIRMGMPSVESYAQLLSAAETQY
ncbi:hypothetical protein LTR22_028165 [Elasticomyces elasticus]|nr:hypothetical protein LTR22_028165 [Elasticomyces elasticus]